MPEVSPAPGITADGMIYDRRTDLTDLLYEHWHVLKKVKSDKNRRSMWECRCQACGEVQVVSGHNLRFICGKDMQARAITACRNCCTLRGSDRLEKNNGV